ncbi:MAG: OmpA family protein, partial [Burkholderiales bacterium]
LHLEPDPQTVAPTSVQKEVAKQKMFATPFKSFKNIPNLFAKPQQVAKPTKSNVAAPIKPTPVNAPQAGAQTVAAPTPPKLEKPAAIIAVSPTKAGNTTNKVATAQLTPKNYAAFTDKDLSNSQEVNLISKNSKKQAGEVMHQQRKKIAEKSSITLSQPKNTTWLGKQNSPKTTQTSVTVKKPNAPLSSKKAIATPTLENTASTNRSIEIAPDQATFNKAPVAEHTSPNLAIPSTSNIQPVILPNDNSYVTAGENRVLTQPALPAVHSTNTVTQETNLAKEQDKSLPEPTPLLPMLPEKKLDLPPLSDQSAPPANKVVIPPSHKEATLTKLPAEQHSTPSENTISTSNMVASLPPTLPKPTAPLSVQKTKEAIQLGHQPLQLTFTKEQLEITQAEQAKLNDVIAVLKEHKLWRIKLISYASASKEQPSSARRISLQRAISVRKYFIE